MAMERVDGAMRPVGGTAASFDNDRDGRPLYGDRRTSSRCHAACVIAPTPTESNVETLQPQMVGSAVIVQRRRYVAAEVLNRSLRYCDTRADASRSVSWRRRPSGPSP